MPREAPGQPTKNQDPDEIQHPLMKHVAKPRGASKGIVP